MTNTDGPNAKVLARITGILILAFVAVELVIQMLLAWIRAVIEGDVRLGERLAHELLDLIGPTYYGCWMLSLLALGVGLLLLARARSSARPAALVGGLAGTLGFVAAVRVSVLLSGPLDDVAFEQAELWRVLTLAGELLVRLGGITAVWLLAREHASARAIRALAGLSLLRPVLISLVLAEVDFAAALFEPDTNSGALLDLASDAVLGVAFVWVSAGVDEPVLDRASARALDTARVLLWIRVGLAIASVTATSSALRAAQLSRISTSYEPPSELLTGAAIWLSQLEGAASVAFAGALALIGLRHRARERLLGAAGASLLFLMALVGFGLSVALRDALRVSEYAFVDPPLDYLRLVESIDPYLRGATVVGMIALVVVLMQVGDPTGVRSDHRVRGVRFIMIASLASLALIFGRDALGHLGKGALVVGLLALGIMALIDLTMLLRTAAKALRGELDDEDDFDQLDDMERFNRYGRGRWQ